MPTTTLTWHKTADQLPDDDILVIGADANGETDSMFLIGADWRYADGMPAGANAPVWWAQFPAGPEVE